MYKRQLKNLLYTDKQLKYVLSILICLLYVGSPIDIIPELLIKGPIGYIDDIIVVILTITNIVLRMKGVWIVDEEEEYKDVTFTRRGSSVVDTGVLCDHTPDREGDTVSNPESVGLPGDPLSDSDADAQEEETIESIAEIGEADYIERVFQSVKSSDELRSLFSTAYGRGCADDGDGGFW